MASKIFLKKFIGLFLCFLIIIGLIPKACAQQGEPSISATAAILVDATTGFILYQKNPKEKRFPASTTKIMTALLALEHLSPDDMIEVTEKAFDKIGIYGSSAGLKKGEKMPVRDILYTLMLPSANEAANVLAIKISGNVEEFSKLMNKRALELGCTGTNFQNCNGLHDENHYTTAYDLYLIAKQAMTHELFAQIVNTAQKTLLPTNLTPKGRKVFSTNRLILRRSDSIYYDYCIGTKTGFTTPAGYCFVSAAQKKDSTLISVVLGSEYDEKAAMGKNFQETKDLFEWGFNNFVTKELIASDTPIIEAPIRLSAERDSVVLIPEYSLCGMVPKDISDNEIIKEISINEDIRAPISERQQLGSVTVKYDGHTYDTIPLVSLQSARLSKVLYYVDILENFFDSYMFKIIVVATIALVIFYIVLYIFINRMRRKRRLSRKNRQDTRRYKGKR